MEYDGTDYFGFQRQIASQPTIQGELESALNRIASEPVPVTGAGRTDSGVHARGQVISFELTWRHGTRTLQRAINANLPVDIAIRSLEVAHPDFHPRYDARRRAYEYHLYNAAVRSPLRDRGSWHVRRPLDVDKMNRAADHLLGVHDFATFGQPPQGTNSVRELFRAAWERQDPLLVFHIEGNAFLYRMVRSIVGSLRFVGDGQWTVEEFQEAFEARERGQAAPTAPACGLYLVSVAYDT